MDRNQHEHYVREAVRLEWIKTPIRSRSEQSVADEIIKGDLEMIDDGTMTADTIMAFRKGIYERLAGSQERAA